MLELPRNQIPRHRPARPWVASSPPTAPVDLILRVFLIPFVIIAASALVAAGLFPVFGGAGKAVKLFSNQFLDLSSKKVDIGTFPLRSTIYASDGSELATVAEFNRTYVTIDEIPKLTQDAVVAIEDHGFYQHGPVDPAAIIRAILQNFNAHDVVSGASTITQQLVKNTIGGKEETLQRKIQEAQDAILLERTYSKQEILEAYLNEIYFGHGTYGIGSASEWYFAKEVKNLTLAQSALLAGVISSPTRWDPVADRKVATARRNQVLDAMLKYGFIDQAAHDEAIATPIKLRARERTVNAPGAQPYVVQYVQNQILFPVKDAPWYKTFIRLFGKTVQDRERTLLQGGLQIYTTINPKLQTAAENAVEGRIPDPGVRPPASNPEAAMVSIVPQTGAITAMYGGPDFEHHKLNLAVQARRQAGSSFKAFTLAAALENGIPAGKVYDTPNPVTIPQDKCPSTPQWQPSNAEPGGGGFISMAQATAASVNVYFAQLIADVGAANVQKVAEAMGVRSYASNSTVVVSPVCAITLGSVEVNPLSMTSGYSTLANGGKHCWPFAIRRIVAPSGKVLFKDKPSCEQVIDPHTAAAVTGMLQGVISGGTGTAANIGRPAAGKTGTAQSFTDAWFVGYVPQLVTGVWVGYGYPTQEISIVGAPVLHGAHPFGGTLAAPIWHDFMAVAVAGLPALGFPVPPPVPGGTVPDVVGMKEADATTTLAKANFTVDVQTGPSDKPAGIVYKQDPAGGSSVTLGTRVTIFVSNGKAPTVTVPSVLGLKQNPAVAKLESAGFSVSIVLKDVGDPAQDGVVIAQAPAGGSKLTQGKTVTITVGVFSSPSPTPTGSP